jgi:hypothetical protein
VYFTTSPIVHVEESHFISPAKETMAVNNMMIVDAPK